MILSTVVRMFLVNRLSSFFLCRMKSYISFCSVVDEVPGCLNFELPTFGNWGARIEDPNDQLNPYAGEAQNWEVWHQNNDLWYMVGKQDTAVFKDREDKEICRHLDACGKSNSLLRLSVLS